jgi:hypothetical protein
VASATDSRWKRLPVENDMLYLSDFIPGVDSGLGSIFIHLHYILKIAREFIAGLFFDWSGPGWNQTLDSFLCDQSYG